MKVTIPILTISGDIFTTVKINNNKYYNVLQIVELFEKNKKISTINNPFKIINNENIIYVNQYYHYFSDEIKLDNLSIIFLDNLDLSQYINDIDTDKKIPNEVIKHLLLDKNYRQRLLLRNNKEIYYDKEILIFMITNLCRLFIRIDFNLINKIYEIKELDNYIDKNNNIKSLYLIGILYNVQIVINIPEYLKEDKNFVLELIETSKKCIYLKKYMEDIEYKNKLDEYHEQLETEEQLVIMHLNYKLRNDKDIVYESIKHSYKAFKFASLDLKNDKEFLKIILNVDCRIVKYLSDETRSMIKFII